MSEFEMSTVEHIKLIASTIDVATEVESEVETKAQVSQGSAARRISKHSFICTIRPTVHTNPSR